MAFTVRKPPEKEYLDALAEKYKEVDPKALDLMIRFMVCSSELEELVDHHFHEHELSQARFSCMMMLYKCPHKKSKPTDMADHLGVTRGNMTGILDNLERDGIVYREDDAEDRRINYVRLSDKGVRHLQKMLPNHFDRIRRIVAPLTKAERETFVTCLEKLRGSMAELKIETMGKDKKES